MPITFENNILYLSIVEAKSIKEGEIVPFLFEVEEALIANYQPPHKFDFRDSEPQYPSILSDKEKSRLAEKYQLNPNACQQDKHNRTVSYQLALFWHFVGDGTHHSEHIKTPFGFYPGQTLVIENRYNVKPTPAFIKNIRLTRFNEEKWFWLVEIERL